jgi:hypothetical protein
MHPGLDHERRRFLRSAAMTIGAARAGLFGRLGAGAASASVAAVLAEAGVVEANERAPRELATIGNAAEWINSPRLTPSTLSG